MGTIIAKARGRACALSLAAALSVALGLAIMCPAAYADDGALSAGTPCISTQADSGAKKTGWVKTKYGKTFYRNGKMLKGLRKIEGKYYYFSPKGIMTTEDVRVGKTKLFINPTGEIFGARYDSTYYYHTLKRMTKADAYNFGTYLKARSIMASITEPGDSKATKMRKAYDWVNTRPYVRRKAINASNSNWVPRQARYTLNGKAGDCHASAGALAYLFATLGLPVDIYATFAHPRTHCWVMIGNKVYDTIGEPDAFNVDVKKTGLICGAHYDVPLFNASHASRKAKPAVKLLRKGIAESPWRTLNGKRYYFKDGSLVKGSVKIGSRYYVFDEGGELMESSKAGTRIVKVSGKSYRVNEKGRAISGWSTNRDRRYDETGALLTGIQVVGSKFYVADSKGVYQKKKTKTLNKAAKRGARATTLRRLLGEPNELLYAPSCEFAGDDGLWEYDTFFVSTKRPTEVKETINEAIEHEDRKPFESIRTVFAS